MNRTDSMLTRRTALVAAVAAAASPLSACSGITRRPDPICPDSTAISYPAGDLTIDAHTHVFNGTDLQVGDFVGRVMPIQTDGWGAAFKAIGDLLQAIGWTIAPGEAAETEALDQIEQQLEQCKAGAAPALSAVVARFEQSAYAAARAELATKAQSAPSLRNAIRRHNAALTGAAIEPLAVGPEGDVERDRLEAIRFIDALPISVSDHRVRSAAAGLRAESSSPVTGLLRFVLQNLQYRYVTIHNYLMTYARPGDRVVDLMVAHMVDFDWWLSGGASTPTSIPAQVGLMGRISALARGRVHAFVPFCPLRAVAYKRGIGAFDPLRVAQAAVREGGCLGVKLYPPMGFAALGNAGIQKQHPDFWRQSWLPQWVRGSSTLGQDLDDALRALYEWATKEDVPLMAHTSVSNGPSHPFQELVTAEHWQPALDAYPRLRVNFGHFGASGILEDRAAHARKFIGLMQLHRSSPAYADAAYFVEVIRREPDMQALLMELYQSTATPGSGPPLAERLLYGTDWEMCLAEWPIDTYLSDFVRLFEPIARMLNAERAPSAKPPETSESLSRKFFGLNAASYLGLRKGERNRVRVEAFYAKRGVSAPDWMTKLDAVPA